MTARWVRIIITAVDTTQLFSGFASINPSNIVSGIYETKNGEPDMNDNLLITEGYWLYWNNTDMVNVYSYNGVAYDNALKLNWLMPNAVGIIMRNTGGMNSSSGFIRLSSGGNNPVNDTYGLLHLTNNSSYQIIFNITSSTNPSDSPVPVTITFAMFSNKSLLITFLNNNAYVTGYDYSVNNGGTWTNIITSSLTTLTVQNIFAAAFFYILVKAKKKLILSSASNMVQCVPKSIPMLISEQSSAKQILQYGHTLLALATYLSLPQPVLVGQLKNTCTVSEFKSYGATCGLLRRTGYFTVADLSYNFGLENIPPPQITIYKLVTNNITNTTQIWFSFPSDGTPLPNYFSFYRNNNLIGVVDISNVNLLSS